MCYDGLSKTNTFILKNLILNQVQDRLSPLPRNCGEEFVPYPLQRFRGGKFSKAVIPVKLVLVKTGNGNPEKH
jgi:hypothetical protein